MPDLRVPAEWETHEGIRIANNLIYYVEGRDLNTPIDYGTWKDLTQYATVSPIQKSDTVSDRLLSESTLIARLEAEYKTQQNLRDFGSTEMEEYHYSDGVMDGLRLAMGYIRN